MRAAGGERVVQRAREARRRRARRPRRSRRVRSRRPARCATAAAGRRAGRAGSRRRRRAMRCHRRQAHDPRGAAVVAPHVAVRVRGSSECGTPAAAQSSRPIRTSGSSGAPPVTPSNSSPAASAAASTTRESRPPVTGTTFGPVRASRRAPPSPAVRRRAAASASSPRPGAGRARSADELPRGLPSGQPQGRAGLDRSMPFQIGCPSSGQPPPTRPASDVEPQPVSPVSSRSAAALFENQRVPFTAAS